MERKELEKKTIKELAVIAKSKKVKIEFYKSGKAKNTKAEIIDMILGEKEGDKPVFSRPLKAHQTPRFKRRRY
ncbi:MAG: hypothetical protein ACTSU7_00965 [Candidatus Heimdallarchaeaceae archaeon]